MKTGTKEKQYNYLIDKYSEMGPVQMSIRGTTMWLTDPKLLLFTLSRHKFVSKMLAGYNRVLEVGCGDAFASRLLHPEVQEIHSIDFDPIFIEDAKKRQHADWPVTYCVHDITNKPYYIDEYFDAAFSLDVIEHIPIKQEVFFMENICKSLKKDGIFICGTPSVESQVYASDLSKEGHVNCKTAEELKQFLGNYFNHVFLFGMNDEVLHTGYFRMCHYIFALCASKKTSF